MRSHRKITKAIKTTEYLLVSPIGQVRANLPELPSWHHHSCRGVLPFRTPPHEECYETSVHSYCDSCSWCYYNVFSIIKYFISFICNSQQHQIHRQLKTQQTLQMLVSNTSEKKKNVSNYKMTSQHVSWQVCSSRHCKL